jgi:hypothetical protein
MENRLRPRKRKSCVSRRSGPAHRINMIANILNKPQVQELKKEEILALPAYALVCVDFDQKQAEKNREDIEFHLVVDLDRIYGRNHKSIKRIYRLA